MSEILKQQVQIAICRLFIEVIKPKVTSNKPIDYTLMFDLDIITSDKMINVFRPSYSTYGIPIEDKIYVVSNEPEMELDILHKHYELCNGELSTCLTPYKVSYENSSVKIYSGSNKLYRIKEIQSEKNNTWVWRLQNSTEQITGTIEQLTEYQKLHDITDIRICPIRNMEFGYVSCT